MIADKDILTTFIDIIGVGVGGDFEAIVDDGHLNASIGMDMGIVSASMKVDVDENETVEIYTSRNTMVDKYLSNFDKGSINIGTNDQTVVISGDKLTMYLLQSSKEVAKRNNKTLDPKKKLPHYPYKVTFPKSDLAKIRKVSKTLGETLVKFEIGKRLNLLVVDGDKEKGRLTVDAEIEVDQSEGSSENYETYMRVDTIDDILLKSKDLITLEFPEIVNAPVKFAYNHGDDIVVNGFLMPFVFKKE